MDSCINLGERVKQLSALLALTLVLLTVPVPGSHSLAAQGKGTNKERVDKERRQGTQGKRGQSDRGESDRGRSDRGKSERGNSDRGKSGKVEKKSREDMEKQLRIQSEKMLRERIRLSDVQVSRVRATTSKYGPRRQAVLREFREANRSLKNEVDKGTNHKEVSRLMARTKELQRQHLKIVEEEEKELSEFLTPVQLAQYRSMQKQLRQKAHGRVEQR